jgi:integrase
MEINQQKHRHNFIEKDNYMICECGKKKLALKTKDSNIISNGIKSDGKKYSVRHNRDSFFYPNDWMKFFDSLKTSQKITFDFLINTGARINEARNVKVEDIDFERNNIILRVTKVKAIKGEKNPRPRTISISNQFSKRLRLYIKDNNLNNNDTLRILSTPAANICLKKTLQKIGIKDWFMFSVHNIRKTHGNWLKALGLEGSEICLRLGHDYNTFLKAYGSPDIFNFKDLQDMRLILGDLYALKQRRQM